jgi:hypothetical protein
MCASLIPDCQGCTDSSCWTLFQDLQTCTKIVADRDVSAANATVLTAAALTRAQGYLQLSGNVNITHFSAPALKVIEGGLKVTMNAALVTFSLPTLTTIGGALTVSKDDLLLNLDLPTLQSVAGHVYLGELGSMTLVLLPSLQRIGGDLTIRSFSQLVALIELPTLTYVGGIVLIKEITFISSNGFLLMSSLERIGGHLEFDSVSNADNFDVSALERIDGHYLQQSAYFKRINMASLAYIGERFELNSVGSMTSLAAPSLTHIGDLVSVQSVYGMSSLSFPSLKHVDWTFTVTNTDLKSIDLSSLETAGSLEFTSAHGLTQLDLPKLWSAGSSILVGYTSDLTYISLPSLTSYTNSIRFESSYGIKTISIPALTRAGRTFVFMNLGLAQLNLDSLELIEYTDLGLGSLHSLTAVAFPSLTFAGMFITTLYDSELQLFSAGDLTHIGSLQISSNYKLTMIALPSLTHVSGKLELVYISAVTSVDFSSLREVGGNIDISSGVSGLTRLDMPMLQRIGGSFVIQYAYAITLIDLSALQSVGNSLRIESLSKLATLTMSALTYVNGNVIVCPSTGSAFPASIFGETLRTSSTRCAFGGAYSCPAPTMCPAA